MRMSPTKSPKKVNNLDNAYHFEDLGSFLNQLDAQRVGKPTIKADDI